MDGKAGLFLAVHERWLAQIRETERSLREQHVHEGADAAEAAASAARVIIGVFDAHAPALRALIDRSAHDPELLARGGAASRRMLGALAATIPAPPEQRLAVVRAVYAEGLLRVMYGDAFLEPVGESPEAFRERVIRVARALAAPR